mmetsp:Transcript_46418/g.145167  ORF Transcript_46418/g.145167 Transcript_46418/m.145167 type:complete len:81 (-) Transcript_46418:7-249(-)
MVQSVSVVAIVARASFPLSGRSRTKACILSGAALVEVLRPSLSEKLSFLRGISLSGGWSASAIVVRPSLGRARRKSKRAR